MSEPFRRPGRRVCPWRLLRLDHLMRAGHLLRLGHLLRPDHLLRLDRRLRAGYLLRPDRRLRAGHLLRLGRRLRAGHLPCLGRRLRAGHLPCLGRRLRLDYLLRLDRRLRAGHLLRPGRPLRLDRRLRPYYLLRLDYELRLLHPRTGPPGNSRGQVGSWSSSGCPGRQASYRWARWAAGRSPRPSPVRKRRNAARRGSVSSSCLRDRSQGSRPPCSTAPSWRPPTGPGHRRPAPVPRLAARWELDRECPRPVSGSPRKRLCPRRIGRCHRRSFRPAAEPWQCARWGRPRKPGRPFPWPEYVRWRRRGVRRPRLRRPVRRYPAPCSSRRSGRTRTPLAKAELLNSTASLMGAARRSPSSAHAEPSERPVARSRTRARPEISASCGMNRLAHQGCGTRRWAASNAASTVSACPGRYASPPTSRPRSCSPPGPPRGWVPAPTPHASADAKSSSDPRGASEESAAA